MLLVLIRAFALPGLAELILIAEHLLLHTLQGLGAMGVQFWMIPLCKSAIVLQSTTFWPR